MDISPYFELIQKRGSLIKYLSAVIIASLIVWVCVFVYLTGGIKYVFSHSMYVPVILAAIVFGFKGGIVVGILGGLAIGPFMPIDTTTGEAQNTINWVYRMGFFSLIGFIVGVARDCIYLYINRIRWIASHDKSTGLLNRYALEQAIDDLKNHDGEGRWLHHLSMVSLANFMEIETTFGLPALNAIILQMEGKPPIYRIDNHNLGILCHNKDSAAVNVIHDKMAKSLLTPFEVEDFHLHGDVYSGIVAFNDVVHSPSHYIQKAEMAAMNARHERQKEIVFISAENQDKEVAETTKLLGQLKDALENGQLSMHYQPKVYSQTGIIQGVEALMRWSHPTLGNIPPGRFIPRAEKSTLIDQLTKFAIDQSLMQIVKWRRQGINLKIAVNISTRNLADPDFADTVIGMLEQYGVDGKYLELEITESSFMANIDAAISALAKLAGVHIIVSIDDFGTGYSSLQYLQKLPVTIIKLDQMFVKPLPFDIGAVHIVEAAVSLAEKLGLKVVAEGVETKEGFDFIRKLGCHLAQGYYIARPMPANELTMWYESHAGQIRDPEQVLI